MDVCNYLPPKIALKIFGSVFNDSLSILALRLETVVLKKHKDFENCVLILKVYA
jgi:hypothetical protein